MKYVENGGDVRATSANPAYMGVVFQGTIEDALEQARAQPDHGIPKLNGRAELLAFLRVEVNPFDQARASKPGWVIRAEQRDTERERDSLVPPSAPSQPWDGLSPFSLEYAIARWPQNFKAVQS